MFYCQVWNITCHAFLGKNVYISPFVSQDPPFLTEPGRSPGVTQLKKSYVQMASMTFNRPNQILSSQMWDTKKDGQLVVRTEVDRDHLSPKMMGDKNRDSQIRL